MKILLASQSPRRKELLSGLGFGFNVVKIDCDEILPQEIEPKNAASYLSELKANTYQNLQADEVLITADTVVVFKENILGKPKDRNEAFETIRKLSGSQHQVFTGITVKNIYKSITETDVATVYFDEISDDEINYYIDAFKPFDKAGSYGIQEWIGMAKIKKIEGSFYTIMGLPTHLLYKMIRDINNSSL